MFLNVENNIIRDRMKKDSLFLAIASVFSIGCYSQPSETIPSKEKGNKELMSDSKIHNEQPVMSYYVEERINMVFGSSVTTYSVSSLSLVNTTDLGPNNTRVITPKYAKGAIAAVNNKPLQVSVDTTIIPLKPIIPDKVSPEEKMEVVNVAVIDTYERVLDKGYQSVDMLKKAGDSRYFDGNFSIAAKWYSQLFALTTDLEAIYYYRYAQSLNAIGQIEKANEMMAIFKTKN